MVVTDDGDPLTVLYHPAAAKVTASIDTPAYTAKKKGDKVGFEGEATDGIGVVVGGAAATGMSHNLAASYASTTEHLPESAHLVLS